MAEIAEPPSRRQQRRAQHLDISRAQLLDAAEEVFGAKGYYATTLKEIADLAEFSVGSVYSFFDNKGDLFGQVFLRRGAEIVDAMAAAIDAGGTPVEQLHRLVDAEVGFFRAHPHFARLFLRSSNLVLPRPGEDDRDDPQNDRFHEAMGLHADLFRRGQRSGDLRAGDPEVLARLLSGMVTAFQAIDVDAGAAAGDGTTDGASLGTLHGIVEDAFVP
jgi:TetR/AcrR family transcriptional regulator